MTKLKAIATTLALSGVALTACVSDQADEYRGGSRGFSYPMYVGSGEDYIKVNISSLKPFQKESEQGYTQGVKAYVSVYGQEGKAGYVLYAEELWSAESEYPKLTVSLNRQDGVPTNGTITLTANEISSEYNMGPDNLQAHFAHRRFDELLEMQRDYGTTDARMVELGQVHSGDWKGHPLVKLAGTALRESYDRELITIDPERLELAIGAAAPWIERHRPDLEFDPGAAWSRELAGQNEEGIEISQRGGKDNATTTTTTCPFPDSGETQVAEDSGAAAGVTGEIVINKIKVDVLKVDRLKGLKGTAHASLDVTENRNVDCPGWNWGEVQVEGVADAKSEIKCEGTTCCKNYVKDTADTAHAKLMIGNEGVDLNGPGWNADSTGGYSQIKGTMKVCIDEDTFSGNDYLGHSDSIKFEADWYN